MRRDEDTRGFRFTLRALRLKKSKKFVHLAVQRHAPWGSAQPESANFRLCSAVSSFRISPSSCIRICFNSSCLRPVIFSCLAIP